MIDFENEVEQALNENVDMSKEEYVEQSKKMDDSTKKHGVEGRAPVSEAIRHKRVQTNFYATALNVLVNIYQLTAEIAERLKELTDGRNEN